MADPLDGQAGANVATSRTREQTFLYAMPEVQVHREEIAPESPYLREGIPHIAEAAERDRAQIAAHEVALRSQFSSLSTEELVARRNDLRVAADGEARAVERRSRLQERIERAREHIESYEAEREAAQALPRRQCREELARIDAFEIHSLRALPRLEAEMQEVPIVGNAARRELTIAEHVLAERRELVITAARVAAPAYVKRELGERPSDPTKQKAWDRGVASIERYRHEHGVKDPDHALGRDSGQSAERARQQTQQRLRQVQRELGRIKEAARARDMGRSMGIGR